MNTRIPTIIFLILLLIGCKPMLYNPVGVWKLSSVINSSDVYANRSSLIPEKVESNMVLILENNGHFTSNGNLCNGNWKETMEKKSVGKYYYKKNPDNIFRLETNECPGIGGDHHFILKDRKLELYYPSVTGYRIQIFEKVSNE
ncbi:hypothetical protein JET18_06450 [Chryseobacterium sp. L7]|uniref:Lipocalin-like domain-containing protein n=1 Tax=Chryseobacterium endalhagicum TaxID=2797638 RepID=A0ABS1QCX8_9FLAO|nr:hypothetical protein [Chryseobacterium endalhagicum]MBL1220470.1 hypothetical protein [Chryseobacterium endalhagicum]